MVKLRIIFKKRNQIDGESAIVKFRNEISDEEEAQKEKTIVEKRKQIDDDEEEEKERAIVKNRKQLDGERAIEIDGVVKCRNTIDEEEMKKERSVIERKQIDGERIIEIDEEEEEEQKERAIVKKRIERFALCINQKVRAVVEKKEQLDGEKTTVICRNEIDDDDDEAEENIKDTVIGEKSKDLPEDLLIEGVLTRLSARELINCSCASKLWYNTVFNDPRFAKSHFVQNQNKLSLFFYLYNVCVDNTKQAFYFRVEEDNEVGNDVACIAAIKLPGTTETLGNCNGLTCIKRGTRNPRPKSGTLCVMNPIRGEQIGLLYATPSGYVYLCSGFGFDPLSLEYKAVVIFTSETKDKFVSMVFTLGTSSWRKITTTAAEISPPPGSPPFPSGMATKVFRGPPTLCVGDLFWKVTNKVHDYGRTEMLLLFDLHSEKIQFIQYPTECTLTPPPATSTTMNEHQYLVVDQLLEFKGYLCIARSEKIMIGNSDHSGHRCVDQGSFCCCCCKVHLYVLKDKAKQVWTKGETFDVQIKDQEGLLPGPFCCYFGTATAVATPPTRVLTISDQVILSWFDGNNLILYNLRKKLLEVVQVSWSYSSLFRTNKNPSGRCISDDNIYPEDMDYQLHAQVENMVSLKTFIPKGAETIINCAGDWKCAMKNNPPAGYVMTGRNPVTIYTFG